jgi:hypothetical protein
MQTLLCTVTNDSEGVLSYRETIAATFLKPNAAGEPRRVPCVLRLKIDSGQTQRQCKAKVQRLSDGRWETLHKLPAQLIATHAGEVETLSHDELELLPIALSDEPCMREQEILDLFSVDRHALLETANLIMAVLHGGTSQAKQAARRNDAMIQSRECLSALAL